MSEATITKCHMLGNLQGSGIYWAMVSQARKSKIKGSACGQGLLVAVQKVSDERAGNQTPRLMYIWHECKMELA